MDLCVYNIKMQMSVSLLAFSCCVTIVPQTVLKQHLVIISWSQWTRHSNMTYLGPLLRAVVSSEAQLGKDLLLRSWLLLAFSS